MDLAQRVSLHDSVRAMLDEDGGVLLDLDGGKYYNLNGVGSHICGCAKEGLTAGAILEDLSKHYDAPRERLEADLVAFLSNLQQMGFLDESQP